MKLLALDTSTAVGSLAVMDGSRLMAETTLLADKKHGEHLVPAIQSLLDRLGLKPSEIEAYAVGIGPGSFTGLRTGLALVKGLALANPRPVVGVSSLQALARSAFEHHGLILPLIDARKGEIFVATFRADSQGQVVRESADMALPPEALAGLIREPALLLGDGLLRYRKILVETLKENAQIAPESLWAPRAVWIANLALRRLEQGDSDPLDCLVPIYVRATDAELKLGQKPAR